MWPGPAVSISWSARGRSLIQVAAEGRLVAELDPQRPDYWDQDDHALLDPFTGDLPLGDDAPDAASCLPALLVLAERLTGVIFTPEALDQPHLLTVRPAGHREAGRL